jgi:ribosomal protein S21
MIQVTKKDQKESTESLMRRFNRKVLQAGSIAIVKERQEFVKPISKLERRKKAIVRRERKALMPIKPIKKTFGPKR